MSEGGGGRANDKREWEFDILIAVRNAPLPLAYEEVIKNGSWRD